MKESADKYLDDLSRKVIGKTSIESPSFGFTNTVMNQIQQIQIINTIKYKPLISKPIWLLIALLSCSGVIYIVFGPQSESSWIPKLNIGSYLSFSELVPDFDVSQITFYVFVLFAIMFSIQIPLLKRQLDKRFE